MIKDPCSLYLTNEDLILFAYDIIGKVTKI